MSNKHSGGHEYEKQKKEQDRLEGKDKKRPEPTRPAPQSGARLDQIPSLASTLSFGAAGVNISVTIPSSNPAATNLNLYGASNNGNPSGDTNPLVSAPTRPADGRFFRNGAGYTAAQAYTVQVKLDQPGSRTFSGTVPGAWAVNGTTDYPLTLQ